MRPGGTAEQPTLIIEGQDVELLRFGMCAGDAILSPNMRTVQNALSDHQAEEGGRSPDYWRDTVEIESNEEILALCGHALKNVIEEKYSIYPPEAPIPGSVSDVSRKANEQIVEQANHVIAELAGGEESLANIMDAKSSLWRQQFPTRVS